MILNVPAALFFERVPATENFKANLVGTAVRRRDDGDWDVVDCIFDRFDHEWQLFAMKSEDFDDLETHSFTLHVSPVTIAKCSPKLEAALDKMISTKLFVAMMGATNGVVGYTTTSNGYDDGWIFKSQ
jgi:hypothetical protein